MPGSPPPCHKNMVTRRGSGFRSLIHSLFPLCCLPADLFATVVHEVLGDVIVGHGDGDGQDGDGDEERGKQTITRKGWSRWLSLPLPADADVQFEPAESPCSAPTAAARSCSLSADKNRSAPVSLTPGAESNRLSLPVNDLSESWKRRGPHLMVCLTKTRRTPRY